MQAVDLVIQCEPSNSIRARQVSAMFDAPIGKKLKRVWKATLPVDERDWSIGLIVGPSGSGKSQIARHIWGDRVDRDYQWDEKSVIDSVDSQYSVKEISSVFGSVGFNTIPSWLKPYHVLSNGERFRVDLARRLLEQDSPIVVDEFSSVVDRQVAKIASHAVAKKIRKDKNKQFVAVTCHRDVEDWLQPDWVFEPDTCEFRWRSLRQRPKIDAEIRRTEHTLWKKFAPYHYMSAKLHKSARCYAMFVNGEPVSFVGVLPRPVSRGKKSGTVIWGGSRTVTLPDWQGLGLAFAIKEHLGSAFKKRGQKFRAYPAHPVFIHSHRKNPNWKMISSARYCVRNHERSAGEMGEMGGRPNAIFEYVGPAAVGETSWLDG